MKLSFEGRTIHDILRQMEDMLAVIVIKKAPVGETILTATPAVVAAAVAKAPIVDKPVEKPVLEPEGVYTSVKKPVDRPVEKRARSEKQLANDEKMRVAALARVAAKRAAKAERPSEPVKKLVEKFVEAVQDAPEPQPFAEPEAVDPTEMVKLRTRTIEELQAAYANGHQQEVFELLSRFGNGAKSFRELPPEAFPEIRKAIDLGALE